MISGTSISTWSLLSKRRIASATGLFSSIPGRTKRARILLSRSKRSGTGYLSSALVIQLGLEFFPEPFLGRGGGLSHARSNQPGKIGF